MSKPLAFIIEDDPQLNQIFSITLNQNFVIEVFANGDLAGARLEQVAPDLIVLDLNLPGSSGSTLLKHIHTDAHLKKSRVILVTADDRQAEVLRDQADVVLLKPISPGLLRELAVRLHPDKGRSGNG